MADPIELLIQGRAHELGPGFAVRSLWAMPLPAVIQFTSPGRIACA